MGLFSRKSKVLDYTNTEGIARNKKISNKISSSSTTEQASQSSTSSPSSSGDYSPFPFFGGNTESNSTNSYSEDNFEELSEDERKRRLGKRLLDITNRLEDLSNQLYHLQQRVELLERKMGD